MLSFFSIVHVLLCVFMIFVILLQPGKDAGMGAALGGGAATSAFGGRGAVTFLGKVTAVCAIGYFITSLGLSFVGMKASVGSSIMTTTSPKASPEAPKGTPPAAGATKPETAPGAAPTPAGPAGTEAVPSEKVPPAPTK